MSRVLLWAVIGWLIWWWWRRQGRPAESAPPPEIDPRDRAGQQQIQQQMVRCARCGVFLPRGEALQGPDDQPYCCAEHRPASRS